jgi:hypothetical protein
LTSRRYQGYKNLLADVRDNAMEAEEDKPKSDRD